MPIKIRVTFAVVSTLLAVNAPSIAADVAAKSKPVLLYTRYFNAKGEGRYQPDTTYKEILNRLRGDFDVRVSEDPVTPASLKGIDVVVVANPSEKASGANPPPHHFDSTDIKTLDEFVRNGGGFVVMGNQENHNLEIEDTNKLLRKFGLQFTNVYTDAKLISVPQNAPIIGGLKWGYYTGNLVLLDSKNAAHPRAVVTNDTTQKPAGGPRNAEGVLMASAEPGKGRVLVITDAGWLTETALTDVGIGNVKLVGQQNWEICHRLMLWLAHR